ncbi:LOW QUALITY PROTEIN: putative leucine-rich repeat-containing protein DDB_G0290503 [Phalaenopsis equestris]|uniref:LOW QUALITY PROTEIN: putative leucine-rich repeat-containing protein DDB_G0290503 n=1 Tax=Phalaenopsis equestris TaxID=78828 RepID=UPI0009E5829A|nr:LOW QUALITY PROTEIN: putative leucine-rich repeat-containing protein DDB_G0290503 [Phalaenopsis equestris]
MKKKQKFQKLLNSVVKSHGEIEEDRKEIENDVKKMLELFENNSEDVSDRSDFVSLVNDIKKRYHALYRRHDGIIGTIKNKFHHRKGESRSGNSDSGSEDSSDEDELNEIQEQKPLKQLSLEDYQSLKDQIDSLSKRNAELEAQTASMQTKLEESQHLAGDLIFRETVDMKLEDELQAVRNRLKLLDSENEFLKTETEKSKEQESKLSLQISGLREENEVLTSEKEKVSSMLLQADNTIVELKFEHEKMTKDARKLKEDNSFLNEELEKKAQEMVHLNRQIVLTSEERENLSVVVTKLESANDSLLSEKERLLFENHDLKAQMEAAIQQVSNQNDKLLMLEGENNGLNSQVLKLSTLMHETNETIKDMKIESELLKEDISKLHNTINDLNHQLKVKEGQNYAMTLEYLESRKLVEQAVERITTLSVEAEMVKNENSVFLTDLENLKLELEGNNQELSKHKQSSKATESKMNSLREENTLLLSWHDDLKLELERNNQELPKIKQAFEATEYDRNSLMEQKTSLLSKINEDGLVIDSLKAQIEELESEKLQLQQKINDLELEIQSANLYFSDVKNALIAAEEEKRTLASENSVVKSKLQKAEFTNEILQNKLEDLNQKNSLLLSKIEEAEKDMIVESGHLKKDISKLQDKITDLNHQLKVKSDENYAMTLEFSESKRMIQQAEKKIMVLSVEAERVKSENSILLAGHENLKLELEGNNKKLYKHEQDLTATESEMNSLREEISFLLSGHENMKVELGSNKRELSKLKEALEVTEFQRNSLIEEKSALLNKIYEDGLVIDGLKSHIEEVEFEKSDLQLKSSDLDLKIQSANLQFTDLKNALAVAEEEKKALVSEKLIGESKLQEAEFIEKRLQSEVAGLIEKNSTLLNKLEEAEKNILIESRCMKENISKLHDTVAELNHQLKVKDDENYALALDSSESKKVIEQSEERLRILSVEAEKILSEKFMLLTEGENLKLVLLNNNQELSKHKQTLEAMEFEINSMKEENSLLLSGHESLKLDLDDNKQELSKLKQALEATEFERNSLVEENSSLLTKVNEVVTAIDALKARIEEVESEKCQLQQKIRYLEIEMKSADLQYTNVTNALVAAEEEKKALVSKISQVEHKLHEANFMNKRLQTELEELNQKNSILLSKIEDAEKATNDFKFERDGLISDNAQLEIKVNKLITALDAVNIQLNHLGKLILSFNDEKTKFKSEISVFTGKLLLAEADNEKLESDKTQLREEKKAFQLNQEGQQNKITDLCKKLVDTSSEIQDLKDKFEPAQEEALHEIQTWSDTFKGDLLEMFAKKGDLDQELKELAEISSEILLSLKKMEDILRSKISDQETFHKSYEQLLTKHKQLEDCYYESCAKLDTAEKKFEQIEMKEEIIQRLERICAEQKNDINKLVENHRGKVAAEKEIQRLEVQLRLSKQKLKITETEYKDKEENCNKLVAELQAELRLLNRYVLIWSRNSTELNNEFKQMKLSLEARMGTLFNELHEVESISQENLGLIKKRLAECLVELQNLKTSLKIVILEKKKLENENHDLTVGLTYKEGIILKLKDETSQNLAHLAEKDKELRVLERRVADSEKNLKEKERLVLDKDEEKREAIRQLCLVIEYHWENRNYLVSYLSSVLRNRGA